MIKEHLPIFWLELAAAVPLLLPPPRFEALNPPRRLSPRFEALNPLRRLPYPVFSPVVSLCRRELDSRCLGRVRVSMKR